ncbi:MAG: OmpA family protein [Sphingomonadales bacterium]|jgi:outer membrane protein OmpA-like peptidoglycan-associated protein
MNKFVFVCVMGLAVCGCASKRNVARQVSELEMRRLAVEMGLADRITKTEANVATVASGVAQVEATANTALATSKAALKLAEGKFNFTPVAAEQVFLFDRGSSKLSRDAQARLSMLAANLKANNMNVQIEIQGHTDSVGSAKLNQDVGLLRAGNVRTFLYLQGVALNRMSVVSMGDTAPVGTNETASGRAANRRVVMLFKM